MHTRYVRSGIQCWQTVLESSQQLAVNFAVIISRRHLQITAGHFQQTLYQQNNVFRIDTVYSRSRNPRDGL